MTRKIRHILITFGLTLLGVLMFLSGWFIKDRFFTPEKDDNASQGSAPQIIVDMTNEIPDDPVDSKSDKEMTDIKKKIKSLFIAIFILFSVTSFAFSERNNDYEYDEVYEYMTTNTFSLGQIRAMATRYFMITEDLPQQLTFPNSTVYILGDKSYIVSNAVSNVSVLYQYDEHKFDELTYNVIPRITVRYTNESEEAKQIIPIVFTDVMISYSTFFEYRASYESMAYGSISIGYDVSHFLNMGRFRITPGVSYLPNNPFGQNLDFFLGIYYNIYSMNLGIGFNFLGPNIGLSIGFQPTKNL